MRTSVILTGSAAFIAIGGLFLLERRHDHEMQDLRSQVAAMGSVNTAAAVPPPPGLTLQVVQSPAPSAQPPAAVQVTHDAAEDSGIRLSASEAKAKRVADLDAYFVGDGASPPGSERAEIDARRKLEADLPEGSSVESFECHATMCRIETAHADREQFQQYLHAAFMTRETALWEGHFYVAVDDSTSHPTAVAFLAREGQDFPQR